MACGQTSIATSSYEVYEERSDSELININVMSLCDEWKSSKGGLSTFNREFAVNLAKTSDSIKVHCYVSQSDEQDREDSRRHGVNLITAQRIPGCNDPLIWLQYPPPELPHPHVVVSHGRKFGVPANFIVRTAKCKWVHFVHVFCEDLGKHKVAESATLDVIEENEKKHKLEIEVCKVADLVVAVGSRLQQKYSRSLPNVKVEIITPGILEKFSFASSQLAEHRLGVKKSNFNVFMFGRVTFEDRTLKGYDIVANAIGSLGMDYELTFVGAQKGEHTKIRQWFLDKTGNKLNANQVAIRSYCNNEDELQEMFQEADLVALPSRNEAFGLVVLEAISAGIPVLVAGESGIAKALQEVEGGKSVIVESYDTEEWARRIQLLSIQSPRERQNSSMFLRENYNKTYSWSNECERFRRMIQSLLESLNGVPCTDLESASAVDKLQTKELQEQQQVEDLMEEKKQLEDACTKLKSASAVDDLQMKELQDKLEAETYFSTLYKSQVKELREEVDAKAKHLQVMNNEIRQLSEERDSVSAQLELTLTMVDSEQLARSTAEGKYSDLEKEKTMVELEVKELIARHKSDMAEKGTQISQLEELNQQLTDNLDQETSEKDELNAKIKSLQEELGGLRKQLKVEETLRTQAAKKVSEMVARWREATSMSHDLRKKEKECRELHRELGAEQRKYGQMETKFQRQIAEYQQNLQMEMEQRQKMQIELDNKDLMIDRLNSELKQQACIAESDDLSVSDPLPKEGWVSIPNKQNIKRYGWRRQYLVVKRRKIFFYNSDVDHQSSSTPSIILEISKLLKVRSVTQGDDIRADDKDIPRIFQILYANEAESVNPVEKDKEEQQTEFQDRFKAIDYMRHQFIPMYYHMPTNCDSCIKPLWHMFKPPPAVECKHCHMKCHKDHVEKEEAWITMCNVDMDLISAKELLVLAQTADEQKQWVLYLSKKIIRKEPKIKSASVRLSGSEEANMRRNVAERNAASRPVGPVRSVSVSSGNRKIT